MLDTEISIRIRTNRDLKQKAAKELKLMGLTVSDAVRMYLHFIATEKKLPTELDNDAMLISVAKEKRVSTR
ncbi:type II toxin-antitoxin system RelB/DinJ family antitoxin [Aggregatibacter actinomycetemcomitans]|uniref:type II toxin-antitoxin system RelB/DinJ family antitoxin n=1 Tax=Aggregatibacter actinomycetemcomitans TaxID=714 RepID=UPI0011D9D51F|nr:type II toxin-antitoxin system RelB/DinJ family antitoxin [Aggregatibacter actinomycetemcomitans]TYA25170.1 type II toxin-antitoxin system RelB/DinJ family antitoxin [Aggregatibacter actinomycetemcomitans]